MADAVERFAVRQLRLSYVPAEKRLFKEAKRD
jgi:hypothetical protein